MLQGRVPDESVSRYHKRFLAIKEVIEAQCVLLCTGKIAGSKDAADEKNAQSTSTDDEHSAGRSRQEAIRKEFLSRGDRKYLESVDSATKS